MVTRNCEGHKVGCGLFSTPENSTCRTKGWEGDSGKPQNHKSQKYKGLSGNPGFVGKIFAGVPACPSAQPCTLIASGCLNKKPLTQANEFSGWNLSRTVLE
jgi:hypothetical protein